MNYSESIFPINFYTINWTLFSLAIAPTAVLALYTMKSRGQGSFISILNLVLSFVMLMNYFGNATFEYEPLINTFVMFHCLVLPILGLQTMLLTGLSFDQ